MFSHSAANKGKYSITVANKGNNSSALSKSEIQSLKLPPVSFCTFTETRGFVQNSHLTTNSSEKNNLTKNRTLLCTWKLALRQITKRFFRFSLLTQEYLQSCQELMEEVLHFNVTETPSSKMENGSTPSTPTDLQEIHFWQRHSLDCRRPSRVYACLSAVCKYCNKELEFVELDFVRF